ncbi:MAG: signal recognition particle protein Srp19 [Methanoregula sp.]|nr:signal recognition particle protein Srp19 [Methanoregula sp.]
MEKGECILYPCYFNAALTRAEGRRVPVKFGAKGPVAGDLERALNKAGISCEIEEHPHPSHWARHDGRVIAQWPGKKSDLIKKVAQRLEVRR